MNILLIYPKCPDNNFWSSKWSLWFVHKKAAFPPLGLMTIGAMLPESWNQKLVDLNTRRLKDKDIKWADMVFISSMIIQVKSAREVIGRCRAQNKKIVVGGPLFFEADLSSFAGVDHFFIGEAESTLPLFLEDLEKGQLKRIYESLEKPCLSLAKAPKLSLIRMRDYTIMPVQYSRGCPFHCDFCSIHAMFGTKLRVKSPEQIITELDNLYRAGWRGTVFFVDDNMIGPRAEAKRMLPAVIEWQKAHHFPFDFLTQASIDLAGYQDLMEMMVQARFGKVFLGIETPNISALKECGKTQNAKCDLAESVREIQRAGMQVMAGFIVGFDNDQENIFDEIYRFIQDAGIVVAMVNPLIALPGTELRKRLKSEGRLIDVPEDADSEDLNFVPKMGAKALVEGFRKLQNKLYAPKHYFKRVKSLTEKLKPITKRKLSFTEFEAFFHSLWRIGVFSRYNWRYLWLLSRTFFAKKRLLPEVVTSAIMYVHYAIVSRQKSRKILRRGNS